MFQPKLALCLLAVFFAAVPAHADNDAVQFGTDIHVNAGKPVHDAVCFFCSVHVDGKVTGDIVVFFGNVHLNGDAQHDVVNFFGKVTAEDNSSIENNLVSFFGGIHLGENVIVGHDMVAMFGGVHAASSSSVGNNRVIQPAWIFFGPLGFLLIIVIVIVREIRTQRRNQRLRGVPFPPR